MPMSQRYKTADPLSFKGRGLAEKKKKKAKAKLATYKGTSYAIKPADPAARTKRKGL